MARAARLLEMIEGRPSGVMLHTGRTSELDEEPIDRTQGASRILMPLLDFAMTAE